MKELKIGMIGLDTSHCSAFSKILNQKRNRNHIKGGRISFAYSGGSKDFSKSHSRVDNFTRELSGKYGVEILDSIEKVAESSDAIFLESCDGRQHLDQFKILAPYKKPVFIDKPLSCSYMDALEISRLSHKFNCPFYSASSLRYYKGINDGLNGRQKDNVASVISHGPVELLQDYPGYYWYGVHVASIVYHLMGSGCIDVKVTNTSELGDIIIANWDDERTATIIGNRFVGGHDWGALVTLNDRVVHLKAQNKPPGYALLLKEVMKFFNTGKSPIDEKEMVEMMGFLEAINISLSELQKNGKEKRVEIESLER